MTDVTDLAELRTWIDELTEIRATLGMLGDRMASSADAEVVSHLCRRLANVEEYLDFLLQDEVSNLAESRQSVTYANVLESDVDRLRHNLGKLSLVRELVYERSPVTAEERELLDTLRAQYEEFFAAPSSIQLIEEVDR